MPEAAPAPPPDLREVTLAVLAGGEGSRMGLPKAELRLDGRPILHALLERIAWPGPTLLVTAPGRERPTGHERFTREVTDPSPGEGPLRGLLTALENAPTAWTVVTAVDLPMIGREQLEWVIHAAKARPHADSLLVYQSLPGGRQLQPFPSAFRGDAVPVVRRLLAANRRSLHALLDEPTTAAIDAPGDWPEDSWLNLNTPEDLESYARRLGRKHPDL